jgi:hypothetical protein
MAAHKQQDEATRLDSARGSWDLSRQEAGWPINDRMEPMQE